jgi:hypothetical protein
MGQAQWRQDRSVPDSSHPDGRLAWFRDGRRDPAAQAAAVEPEPEPAEGECRLGLYSPREFADRADVGGAGPVRLNIRHICGENMLDGVGHCERFPRSVAAVLEQFNTVLTWIFIAELALKLLGLGVAKYFADGFNAFDFVIVMFSIVELLMPLLGGSGGGNSAMSALRGMRLFRLFKLARSWKGMRKTLHTLAVAAGTMGTLLIVWAMIMYISALLGQQWFGRRFKFVKTESPRSNFDSFLPINHEPGVGSFLVVFQMISTENWNIILYNAIMAHMGEDSVMMWSGVVITIAIVYIGNYIVMNLFISILLQGFDEDDDDDDDDAPEEEDEEELEAPLPPVLGPAARTMRSFRRLLGQDSAAWSPTLQTGSMRGSMRGIRDGTASEVGLFNREVVRQFAAVRPPSPTPPRPV